MNVAFFDIEFEAAEKQEQFQRLDIGGAVVRDLPTFRGRPTCVPRPTYKEFLSPFSGA